MLKCDSYSVAQNVFLVFLKMANSGVLYIFERFWGPPNVAGFWGNLTPYSLLSMDLFAAPGF